MRQPLEGIRVLHLTANFPGPLAASKLARAGARVTKVEGPHGDPLAKATPEWYAELHRGQEIRRVDLKTPEGVRELEPLLADSDLFLTSLRPKALTKLGLDWNGLHARFPRLSLVRLQGFAGAREDEPAHDLILQAEAGLLASAENPRMLVADSGAAEMTYSTCLLALLAARQGSGGGLHVVTIAEAAEQFAEPWRRGLTRPGGPLGGGLPGYGIYPASVGQVALAALEPVFAQRFQELFGVRIMDRDAVAALFLTRPAEEWARLGREKDLPLTALATAD